MIDVPAAWTGGYTGAGWAVAVLDSGVQAAHPFFGGNLVSEACYSSSVALGGTFGSSTPLCPGSVSSSTASGSGANCTWSAGGCAHGTHVAGIATGRLYSGAPGGVADGVGKGASLIAIQIFAGFPGGYPSCGPDPCVLSWTTDQIAGLQRVHDLAVAGMHIASVNMSLGGGRFFTQASCDGAPAYAPEKAAIDDLRSLGIATVIASGNSGFTGSMAAPGCLSSAISVGSVSDGSDGKTANTVSDFSNSASFLNLLAPGSAIYSSIPTSTFANFAGTSMATPHVAGAWALMKQRKPLAGVDEILNAFITTGVNITDTRVIAPGDTTGGYTKARIDVNAAVHALRVDYMALDEPAAGSAHVQPFNLSGWALNMSAPIGAGTGIDAVYVYATPSGGSQIFLGTAAYGGARGDVAAALGLPAQYTNCGWNFSVRGLLPGTYRFDLWGHDTFTGTLSQVVSVTGVTVSTNPLLVIDQPASGSVVKEPFVMSGWALDTAAAPGTTGVDGVFVYAYRDGVAPAIAVGGAPYGMSRPDVGAAYGAQFTNSGWALSVSSLTPGYYVLVAYAHDAITGGFPISRTDVVKIGAPAMALDGPAAGTVAPTFTLSGWAIDLGAPTGTGVDYVYVYAYQDYLSPSPTVIPVGFATYGTPRPDVGAIFGARFTSSGYTMPVTLASGHQYLLAVYAHSTLTGGYELRTVAVNVP